jgi:hypothetical protein
MKPRLQALALEIANRLGTPPAGLHADLAKRGLNDDEIGTVFMEAERIARYPVRAAYDKWTADAD